MYLFCHPSTNQAWPCFASEMRHQVCIVWYGHRVILKVISIWCDTPIETFFPTEFLNLLILMSFSAFAHLFHLFYTGKTFPFEDFFHTRGKKKKRSLGVSSDEQGGWGMGVVPFLVKNCWILSVVWAGTLSRNVQMCWMSSKKRRPTTASHNASW